jgi:hypothetical protein
MYTVNSGTHTLIPQVVMDQWLVINPTPSTATVTAGSNSTTWPTNREAPEWRLPKQKCSSIQVYLQARPAVAEWTGVEMMIQPVPVTAPSKQRF